MRRGSHDDGSMVMKGGRKFKRLPMHVSMHVENEASGGLRYRVNQGADSGSCGKEEEAMFITPENQVIPESLTEMFTSQLLLCKFLSFM